VGNGYLGAIAMPILFDSASHVNVNPLDFGADILDDEREPDWDFLAAEAAWYHQLEETAPLTDRCLNCGDRCDDLTARGLCDRCDDLATDATIACVNGLYGLGHRVF
jgi:hypothetical protein